MKIISNIAWVLILILFSFGIGAFYIVGKSNMNFSSFDGYLEEFILGGIGFVIFSMLFGIITLIITKLLKSENKMKISLIVVSIVVAIFGLQAYFLKDVVMLKKQKAIYWEDNNQALIANIASDLIENGYDSSRTNDFANCISDRIIINGDFFNIITDQPDMFMFLIDTEEYYEYTDICVNQKELTADEKAAFEKEMKELIGE